MYFPRGDGEVARAQNSAGNRPKWAVLDIVVYIGDTDSRVSRVVGDSGAVLTIETTRNSELIDTIFKKFALKMVELSCIKGLANNCQNMTSL